MTDSLAGRRILIVDDDPDVCEMVADVLVPADVESAHSYEAARERLSSRRYDAVILDIMGVRGHELLDLYGRNVPCIMLTGHAFTPELVQRSIDGDARLFLPKKEMPRLEEYVKKVLETRGPLWSWLSNRLNLAFPSGTAPADPLAGYRVLIVNRGEPAARAVKEAQALGAAVSLTYSAADRDTLAIRHLAGDDRAICLGPSSPKASYLNRARLVEVATTEAADLDRPERLLVWPGWGFLAEDASFVAELEELGVSFAGPSSRVLAMVGNKVASRKLALSADIPIIPGSEPMHELADARQFIARTGARYPYLIKGLDSGGGRGMRVVRQAEDLDFQFGVALRETRTAGGTGLFMERFLEPVRHVEVQVMADAHGHVSVVDTRDCTLQRHFQKIVEQTAELPDEIERRLRTYARRFLDALQDTGSPYVGPGTVEFLLADDELFFIEMNGRLQVEHGISEMVTGANLVREQLLISAGHPCSLPPELSRAGYSIEVRVTIEDPYAAFLPSPGTLLRYREPRGDTVRVDTGFEEGDTVPPHYDSMIAKLLTWGRDREHAISRLRKGLETFEIAGVKTNLPFLQHLAQTPEFESNQLSTRFLECYLQERASAERSFPHWEVAAMAAAIYTYRRRLARPSALSNTDAEASDVALELEGNRLSVTVRQVSATEYALALDGRVALADLAVPAHDPQGTVRRYSLLLDGRSYTTIITSRAGQLTVQTNGLNYDFAHEEENGGTQVRTPMPGLLVEICVSEGETVRRGDRLAVIEAMKMQNLVVAPQHMTVSHIVAEVGSTLSAGDLILQCDDTQSSSSTGDYRCVELTEPSTHFDTPPGCALFAGAGHDAQARETAWVREHPAKALKLLAQVVPKLLIGYDYSPTGVETLVEAVEPHANELEGILSVLREAFALYVDVETLFSPRFEADLARLERDLDPRDQRLPEALRTEVLPPLLERLDATRGTQALATSLHRLRLAQANHPRRRALITSLLRLAKRLHAPSLREPLERLRRLPDHGRPTLSELAAEVLFAILQDPRVAQSKREALRAALRRELQDGDGLDGLVSAIDCRCLVKCAKCTKAPTSEVIFPVLAEELGSGEARRRSLALEAFFRWSYGQQHRLTDYRDAPEGNTGGVGRFVDADTGRLRRAVFAYAGWSSLDTTLKEAVRTLDWARLDSPDAEVDVIDCLVNGNAPPEADDEVAAFLGDQLEACLDASGMRRVTFTLMLEGGGLSLFTFRPGDDPRRCFREDRLLRNLPPVLAWKLELARLTRFHLERLSAASDGVVLFRGESSESRRPELRYFALAYVPALELPYRDAELTETPTVSRRLLACAASLRRVRNQAQGRPTAGNRIYLYLELENGTDLTLEQVASLARRHQSELTNLDLERVVICSRSSLNGWEPPRREFHAQNPTGHRLHVREVTYRQDPVTPGSELERRIRGRHARGHYFVSEIVEHLCSKGSKPGHFVEYDLQDGDRLAPVDRTLGLNTANLVVGVITNYSEKFPSGFSRVLLLGDASRALGALSEPECRRAVAALELARELGLPVDWFPASSGAEISVDRGTENLDWTAAVARRIVELTAAGGAINVVVDDISVGAQSYWNALATMLPNRHGVLIQTRRGAMVLTGHRALRASGSISAASNLDIGGAAKIMGPNGEAQICVPTFYDAVDALYLHHYYTYPAGHHVARVATSDPFDRDISTFRYAQPHASGAETIGEVLRKAPLGEGFHMRSVMAALLDQDAPAPLERWQEMWDAETAIVWEAQLGGFPVMAIGFESRNLPRKSQPNGGPPEWNGGVLFPLSSKKVARAIEAASGVVPLVVLANLSGFDGSPESLRNGQLEFGAEIAEAIVQFTGPILFVVVARYHGGAYVVFSNQLNDAMVSAAMEGTYASVIGGSSAVKVIGALRRRVHQLAAEDPEAVELDRKLSRGWGAEQEHLIASRRTIRAAAELRAEALVARDYDEIHSVERAIRVGSLNTPEGRPLRVAELRGWLIGRLEDACTGPTRESRSGVRP